MIEYIKRSSEYGGDYFTVDGEYYYSSAAQAFVKKLLLDHFPDSTVLELSQLSRCNDIKEIILDITSVRPDGLEQYCGPFPSTEEIEYTLRLWKLI